jgi:hypothetical protein
VSAEDSLKILHEDQREVDRAHTTETAIVSAGQRKVNLIWEYTQAFIAVVVVMATMGSAVMMIMWQMKGELPTILSVAFGTVVGFYFGRSNHVGGGGVGPRSPLALRTEEHR